MHTIALPDSSLPQKGGWYKAWRDLPSADDDKADFLSILHELNAKFMAEPAEKSKQADRERWYETPEYLALEAACDVAIARFKVARRELTVALRAFIAAQDPPDVEQTPATTPAPARKPYIAPPYIPSYPHNPTPPGPAF